jgi:polyhydroxybutyrate depolymerase
LKLKHDGENRTYLLHLPHSYNEAEPSSLIIALHGGTGSAKNIEEQGGLPEFSDEKGFILCSPNGLNKTWNAGNCCGKAEKNKVDDVGFISSLMDKIQSEYNIDPKRIYITGMSNGAMMSYRLACELSDKIAAIAPMAGTIVTNECKPSNSMSVVHFHSKKDNSVPFDGGIGDGISNHYNAPIDSVMQVWSSFGNCMTDTMEVRSEYDYYHWINCADSCEVSFYITNDGGHSWPGGTQPRKKADAPSNALNANQIMWAFFLQHPKP